MSEHNSSALISRMDRLRVNGAHWKLAMIGGLGLLFDGMDGSLVSYILPILREKWALDGLQSGLIGSSLLIGMLIGALTAGPISDRIGRRRVMMWALMLFTLATLVAAFSMNWQVFFVLRVLAGIGIGAESAVIPTYVAELIPAKRRGLFVGAVAGFLAFGYVLASLIGYFVVAQFDEGWRYGQIITAIPVLLVLWWRRAMPESPRWLLSRGEYDKAEQIVDGIERGVLIPVESKLSWKAQGDGTSKPARLIQHHELLKRDLIGRTLLLWLMWMALTFSFFGFFTWIPSLLVDRGLTVTTSFSYVLLITIAQIPGYYGAAWLNEKIGRKTNIALFLAIGTAGAWLLSQSVDPWQVIASGALLSAGMNGTYAGLYAYTPEVYPTRLRATGMGMASAVGRIGGISAPIIIGVSQESLGFSGVFVMIMSVLALTAVLVVVLGVSTKGRSLEDLTGPIATTAPKE